MCCFGKGMAYLVLASCMAAFGGLLFGYDIGIVSGAVLQLRQEFQLTCTQQEMVVSSMLLGAVIGSLTGGFIVDSLGRRHAIIINSAVFLVGAIILAVAQSYPVLVLGRLIVGFGVSLSAIAECIYISEIAPAKWRGMLVSLNEVGICGGLLLAYLVNFLFINEPSGWRYMFGLSGIPALVQGVGMFFLPHSPRWLIVNGQDDKACVSIQRLQWAGEPREEVMKMKSGLRTEYRYGLRDLFSNVDSMRRRMAVGCGIVFFQQFTGQPTVLYYASTIFEALGFQTGENATLATLGIGLAKLMATTISLCTIDKGGRRRFLLVGVSIMTLSIMTLGIVSHYQTLGPPTRKCHYLKGTQQTTNNIHAYHVNESNTSTVHNGTTSSSPSMNNTRTATTSGYVALTSLMLFVGGYSFGFGPVSWLLLSEIFPAAIKGRAFSFATVLNWGTNLIVSLTFLDLFSSIGVSWTFLLYSIVCVVSVVFIYKYVPETKNKTLEQISAEFNSRKTKNICPAFVNRRIHRSSGHRRRPSNTGSACDMLLAANQVQI